MPIDKDVTKKQATGRSASTKPPWNTSTRTSSACCSIEQADVPFLNRRPVSIDSATRLYRRSSKISVTSSSSDSDSVCGSSRKSSSGSVSSASECGDENAVRKRSSISVAPASGIRIPTRSTVKELQERIDILQDSLNKLQGEKSDLVSSYEDHLINLQTALDDKEQSNESLKNDLNKERRINNSLREEVQRRQSELESFREEFDSERLNIQSKHEDELLVMKKNYEGMMSNLKNQYDNTLSALQEERDTAKRDLNRLEVELETERTNFQNETIRKQVQTQMYETKIHKLESELTCKTSKLNTLSTELPSIHAEKRALSDKVVALQKELSNQMTTVDTMQNEISNLKNDVTYYETIVFASESQLAEKDELVQFQSAELSKRDTTIIRLERQLEDTREEFNSSTMDLRDEISKSHRRIGILEEQLTCKSELLEAVQEELDIMKRDLQNEEKTQANFRFDDLRSQIDERMHTIQSLMKEQTQHLNQIRVANEKLAEKELLLNISENKLQDLENQIHLKERAFSKLALLLKQEIHSLAPDVSFHEKPIYDDDPDVNTCAAMSIFLAKLISDKMQLLAKMTKELSYYKSKEATQIQRPWRLML